MQSLNLSEQFAVSKIYDSKRDFLNYARRQATDNQFEFSTVMSDTKRVGIACNQQDCDFYIYARLLGDGGESFVIGKSLGSI